MNFDILSDWADLQSLQPDWNPLLQRSSADNFFQTWEYLSSWWAVSHERFDCRCLIARDGADGQIVGLAPLIVGRGPSGVRRHVRHLAFAGQLSDSIPDYCDFIVAPGHEAEVMDGFCDLMLGDLAQEWNVLHFPAIRANSMTMARLQERSREAGFPLRRIHERSAAFLNLPASWDEFLAGKSPNFRKKARSFQRRLERSFDAEFVDAANLDRSEALSTLIRLNRQRWGDKGKAFRSGEFNAFHEQLLADHLGAEPGSGPIALNFLTLNGEFVAANYDFVYGGKVWGFQAGWNPDFAKHSVFRVLFGYCVQDFIGRGLEEYDFLAGDAGYKESWATGQRVVQDLEATNPRSLRGRLFNFARNLRKAA